MSQSFVTDLQFINSIGVNAHISQGTSNYGNAADDVAGLKYLDFSNVRDSLNPYWNSVYETLAKAGVKFDFLSAVGGSQSAATISSFLSNVAAINAVVPGSVGSVEGPNEINNWPVTWTGGVTGLQAAVDFQQSFYAQAKADTALPGVDVFYFTGYNAGSDGIGPNPATTPGLADYDTQHPYPNDGNPPLQWISRTQALGNETPSTGPAVYTETGYNSDQVGTTIQAKYTLDLLMDAANSGIAQTYLYQLMDEGDGGGLFDTSNNPKPVAVALHNLTTILADPGDTGTPTVTPASFTLSGVPSGGHDLALTKNTGETDIVLWAEPQISGTASGLLANVTVSLGATYQSVKVFDPLTGTAAIQTLSNASSVTVGLTDHPLIVEVGPATTSSPPPPPTQDTLALNISEDAWQGDAQFTVSVDGTQVGGIETASALHSGGDSGVFLLTGKWGAGPHTVQASFINDAWGGSASTDRNLYVNSIAYDSATYTNTSNTKSLSG